MTALAIVIPVANSSEPLSALLTALRTTLPQAQLIVAGPSAIAAEAAAQADDFVAADQGRAEALNRGAEVANAEMLWFLHVDSGVPKNAARILADAPTRGEALWYFDLRFSDAPALMAVNSLGVLFRSRCLGCPFGDQGFVIRRSLWRALGGYPEGLPYGEDHAFVWRARRAGVAVRSIGATLTTSARKYRQGGWVSTTAKHVFLWARQALAEWRVS